MRIVTFDTPKGIYKVYENGVVTSQSKLKIPLVTAGMKHTGDFKIIIKPEKPLKIVLNAWGYLAVCVDGKTKILHKLLAQCFIPNPENYPQVNHIDGNKLNNSLDNLEWCTCKQNIQHAFKLGLNKAGLGTKQVYKSEKTKQKSLANLKDKSALTPDEVRYVRSVCIHRHAEFGVSALARKFKISSAAMSKIIKKETYSHIQ